MLHAELTRVSYAVRRGARRRETLVSVDRLTIGHETVGLLGANGAGKTTLLRLLATVLAPSSGDLVLCGTRIDGSADALTRVRREVGYLPQRLPFHPRFTAREYVAYLGWTRGMSTTEAWKASAKVLAEVGLGDRLDTRVGAMSGGMQRRVGVAQAIVHSPSLLLLDEPTTGLDPQQRVAFRALVNDLSGSMAVLLSTHLVEDVAATCGRVVVLEGGRIAFDGSTRELADDAQPTGAALESGLSDILAGAGR